MKKILFLTSLWFHCAIVFSQCPAGTTVTAKITAITPSTCYGGSDGSVTITANGGTTPYTYAWVGITPMPDNTKSTVPNLQAGNYSCTVTDKNGCVANGKPITIEQPPQITASIPTTIILPSIFTAPNGSATTNPIGGTVVGTPPNYTYKWTMDNNPGFTPQLTQTATKLSFGSYTCIVTDQNGCTFTDHVELNTLTIDRTKIRPFNPSYKKGNDGAIFFPITETQAVDNSMQYKIAYTIDTKSSEKDTCVVQPITNADGKVGFYLPGLTAGTYSNITIFTGNPYIVPTTFTGPFILNSNDFSNNKGVQTWGIAAATLYNFSGVSNDFPDGFVQTYVSGSIPINKSDGIPYLGLYPKAKKMFKRSVIGNMIPFRNFYGSITYTNPNSFTLKSFDTQPVSPSTLGNRHVNQLDLYNHADYEFSANLNLLTYILPHKRAGDKPSTNYKYLGDDAHIYLDFNYSYINTIVADSISQTKTNNYSVKSHLWGVRLAAKSTHFLNNLLVAKGTFGIFWTYPSSNAVIYNLGPQYSNLNDTSNQINNSSKSLFTNNKSHAYFSFSGLLFYNFNGKTGDSNSNIFIKFSGTSNLLGIKSGNYNNTFYSFQIGYLLGIDKIFYPNSPSTSVASANSVK